MLSPDLASPDSVTPVFDRFGFGHDLFLFFNWLRFGEDTTNAAYIPSPAFSSQAAFGLVHFQVDKWVAPFNPFLARIWRRCLPSQSLTWSKGFHWAELFEGQDTLNWEAPAGLSRMWCTPTQARSRTRSQKY